jgi:hypothetical protein
LRQQSCIWIEWVLTIRSQAAFPAVWGNCAFTPARHACRIEDGAIYLKITLLGDGTLPHPVQEFFHSGGLDVSDKNDIALPSAYMEQDVRRMQQEAQTRQRLLDILVWAELSFEQNSQRVQEEVQTRQRLLKILFWAALSFVVILGFSL